MATVLQNLGRQQAKDDAEQRPRIEPIAAGRLTCQIECLDQEAIQFDVNLAFDRR